jgi:hypothetical protein
MRTVTSDGDFSPPGVPSVGVVVPRAPSAIEPLTSLSPLLLPPVEPLAFAGSAGKEGAAETTVTSAP